ncbi:Adenylate cyclase [Diplonema papillatum]|nr:Adenylate cyclase [Diplonema papillatum]
MILTMAEAERNVKRKGEIQVVDVGYDTIEPLAPWVGKIDVSGNKLANLVFIRGSEQIRCVNVSRNQIVSLRPGDLTGSPLTTLDVSENPLRTLEGVEEAKHLQALIAARCPPSVGLPESLLSVTKLTRLKTLVLRDTPLGDVSLAAVCQLKSLEKLSLARCSLRVLPWRNKPHRLTELKELRLNGNEIKSLDAYLSGCTALRIVDLGSNQLSGDCLDVISTLPRLSHLTLKNNPVAQVDGYRETAVKACRGKLKCLDDTFATAEAEDKKRAKRVRGEELRKPANSKKTKKEGNPAPAPGAVDQTDPEAELIATKKATVRLNTVLIASRVDPSRLEEDYREADSNLFTPGKLTTGSSSSTKDSGVVRVQDVHSRARKNLRSDDALSFLLGKT